jgi:hypothetical protein
MSEDTYNREALVKWVVDRATWTRPAKAVMFGLNLEVDVEAERGSPITMRPFQVAKNAPRSDVEAEAAATVDEFIRSAEGCVATLARPRTFSITAHHSEDPAVMPMAKEFFTVRPRGDFQAPEQQDPRDIIGNLQRLATDAVRSSASNSQNLIDVLQRELADRRLNERALERSLLEAVRDQQKAMNEAVTREIAAKEAQLMITLKEQAFGLFAQWVGEQLSKPSGKAQKSPIASQSLVDFILTLSAPQQQVFVKTLLPGIKSAMSPEELDQLRRALTGAQAAPTNGAARAGGEAS